MSRYLNLSLLSHSSAHIHSGNTLKAVGTGLPATGHIILLHITMPYCGIAHVWHIRGKCHFATASPQGTC